MKLSRHQQVIRNYQAKEKKRQEPMKDAFALYTYVKLWKFKLIVMATQVNRKRNQKPCLLYNKDSIVNSSLKKKNWTPKYDAC